MRTFASSRAALQDGAELKWGTVYTNYAALIAKGQKLPNINGDNKGNLVSDKTLGLYDGVLWQTNYLLDGIVGSIT
jgi:basic membrane protein A and related proteins